ncbi:MAG: hypothetical protein J6S81_07360, partial [Treponema sp.]|nr:hypothetical protein [Treponema sp.]
MIFSGPAFLCKPAFQGSGFRLHCSATRLRRALPIGGRLGGEKARLFFATLLLLLILFARPAYSQEAESASVAPEAESASPESSLSEREEYLEQVQTYNFWSTLGQQFKISSE